MQLSHEFVGAVAVFDDENLVSCAGLVPVLELAESAGLSDLVAGKVRLRSTRVRSAGANPAGKVAAIVAAMAAGADSIDDLGLIRSGGMGRLFAGVYAPATLGQFLREFTFGHARQLASVARAHLVALVGRTGCLPGIESRCFVDIDSLLRPVYGHAKQGAGYGHTKIASKQVMRLGLSPLATTISTADGTPMIAGIRLRGGKAGSGRGAGSMVTEAIGTARAAGASGTVMVRGDSAFAGWPVIGAALAAGAEFSVVLAKNPAVARAIDSIDPDTWRPVAYPGAVPDPDTPGAWISDAEVAETSYTAFAHTAHPVTARLIVRRVRDVTTQDALFPVWPTTRPSPTAANRPTRPTSPTGVTRSSRPPSPTSSTGPWPTCPPAGSARTVPGSSAPPSPTTCSEPPAPSPAATTAMPAAPPCAATSSTSPPAWPAPNADPCSTGVYQCCWTCSLRRRG